MKRVITRRPVKKLRLCAEPVRDHRRVPEDVIPTRWGHSSCGAELRMGFHGIDTGTGDVEKRKLGHGVHVVAGPRLRLISKCHPSLFLLSGLFLKPIRGVIQLDLFFGECASTRTLIRVFRHLFKWHDYFLYALAGLVIFTFLPVFFATAFALLTLAYFFPPTLGINGLQIIHQD